MERPRAATLIALLPTFQEYVHMCISMYIIYMYLWYYIGINFRDNVKKNIQNIIFRV